MKFNSYYDTVGDLNTIINTFGLNEKKSEKLKYYVNSYIASYLSKDNRCKPDQNDNIPNNNVDGNDSIIDLSASVSNTSPNIAQDSKINTHNTYNIQNINNNIQQNSNCTNNAPYFHNDNISINNNIQQIHNCRNNARYYHNNNNTINTNKNSYSYFNTTPPSHNINNTSLHPIIHHKFPNIQFIDLPNNNINYLPIQPYPLFSIMCFEITTYGNNKLGLKLKKEMSQLLTECTKRNKLLFLTIAQFRMIREVASVNHQPLNQLNEHQSFDHNRKFFRPSKHIFGNYLVKFERCFSSCCNYDINKFIVINNKYCSSKRLISCDKCNLSTS